MPPPLKRRDIIVIGGSAGAIDALRALVARLPADLAASIFVTIHIPADFPSILPRILRSAGPLPAIHPADKERTRPGMIYVAPPDFHLLVETGCVGISRGARENRHRPAIDPLFRSAARAYRARVVGVLLSGELDDGSAGLMAIKMRRGLTVVQDPAEAVSPEMPSRAIQYSAPDHILRVDAIAELLIRVSSQSLLVETQMLEPRMSHELDDEARQANLEDDSEKQKRGNPSAFTCPECHGTLWEMDEAGLLRFRCRVGHAYTANELRVAISASTEDALWAAMRTLEERASLLRRLAPRSAQRLAAQYREEAATFDKHIDTIRKILVENQEPEAREREQTDAA